MRYNERDLEVGVAATHQRETPIAIATGKPVQDTLYFHCAGSRLTG